MLIKWIHFAVLVHIISMIAAKHLEDVDFEDLSSESVEDEKTSPCIDGQCDVSKKKRSPQSEFTEQNILDLLKLLSSLANKNKKGETNISINVRDIQSGFKNGGSKYHVGNIHRETTRKKRDTDSVLNENLTTENPSNVQTDDKEATLNVTEKSHKNNGSVDVNVSTVEENNFQDSNAANILVSVTNDTATASLVEGNKVQNSLDSAAIQVGSNSDVNSSEDAQANVTSDSKDKLEHVVPSESKVKVPLSKKALNNIHNVLSDDLGVGNKQAKPVANFSLNVDTDNSRVVVLVYNCSCGSKDNNHTHDNNTKNETICDNSNKHKNTVLLDTRRSLSSNQVVLRAHSKVYSEEKLVDADKSVNKNENESSNADIENEFLQKCNSLLSLQLQNKEKKTSEAELSKDGNDVNNFDELKVNIGDVNVATDVQAQNENETSSEVEANSDFDVSENINAGGSVSELENSDKMSRKKRGLSDIIEKILKYLMIVPDNSTESDSAEGSKEEVDNSTVTVNIKNHNVTGNNDGNKTHARRPHRSKINHADDNKSNTSKTVEDNNRKKRSATFVNTKKSVSDGSKRAKRDVKTLRNPIYYEYVKDKPNLLESDSKTDEYDGIVVNFKSADDNEATEINVGDILNSEEHKNDDSRDLLENEKSSPLRGVKIFALFSTLQFKPGDSKVRPEGQIRLARTIHPARDNGPDFFDIWPTLNGF